MKFPLMPQGKEINEVILKGGGGRVEINLLMVNLKEDTRLERNEELKIEKDESSNVVRISVETIK